MFPFIDTAPRARYPVVVLSLIAINTLVFIWTLTLTPRELNEVLVQYALIPARYTYPALARSVGLDPNDYWPLLTNTFLHGGWMHIIFNMWFLWIFGPAMEARFGRFWFVALYIAGAFFASATFVAVDPEGTTPVLGASGAIAALIAAYCVIYPTERVITIVPIIVIPLFVPVPAILFGLIWFGLQIWQGTSTVGEPEMAAGIAWWAHIGGFVFGAVFAILARLWMSEMQTRVTRWSEMHDRRTRGRRVPDIKPRDWD